MSSGFTSTYYDKQGRMVKDKVQHGTINIICQHSLIDFHCYLVTLCHFSTIAFLYLIRIIMRIATTMAQSRAIQVG